MTLVPPRYAEWVESLVDEYTNWFKSNTWEQRRYNEEYKELPFFQLLANANQEEERMWIVAMADWLKRKSRTNSHSNVIYQLFGEMLKVKRSFKHDEVVVLIEYFSMYPYRYTVIIKILKNYLSKNELTPALQDAVSELVSIADGYSDSTIARQSAKMAELAGLKTKTMHIRPGEAWADRALEDIGGMEGERKAIWESIIEHCMRARQAKPSKRWTTTAEKLLKDIGYDAYKSVVKPWFALADKPRTQETNTWRGDSYITPINADILRGLVWFCAFEPDLEMADALADLAVSAYRKEPGVGPRCVSVGNASIWVLGMMPGLECVSHLARLKVKIKVNKAKQSIAKALLIASEREGISPDEIEEITVPSYGMQEVGVRREPFGDFTAELTVTGTTSTQLVWIKPDGKTQKSVPKAVKDDFKEELKALKKAAQDIKKLLPAHRDRIDTLYLQQKQWALFAWRERYLDHPLVGTLARRLIWVFETEAGSEAGIWHEGDLVDANGAALEGLGETTTVRLWHPLDADTDAIVAWRNWLLQRQIQQPFKQAYREIYLLTDAERNTRVYSNRFASHIIRQHQFNALCGIRGWKNQLRLMVDDYYQPAGKVLPLWDLRVEYWVEGVGEDFGTDTNDTGTFYYLATDQVRFYPSNSQANQVHAGGGGYGTGWGTQAEIDPIPLEDIPPLVFSEVMRDVDLFVGVASIGNDPNWMDGGEGVRHVNYWQSFAFGDLSATAKTRKAILEQLVPALMIADRCELEGKFLTVRGDIRSYKIHLGSGNILMSPNDQYLCIVPDQRERKKSDKVFLPFEGDKTLAVILSKAFMLADDTKIKDRTIVSQIKM